MAQGDVYSGGNSKKSICILEGEASQNGAPTLATDGVPVYPESVYGSSTGLCFTNTAAKTATITLTTTNASTPNLTICLWGYLEASARWHAHYFEANIAAAPHTSQVAQSVELNNLGHFDRLYLELYSNTGVGSEGLTAWITTDAGHSS